MGQLKKISELETLASVASGTYAPVVDASGNSKKFDLNALKNPTLKTVNNQSLEGSGNISIASGKGISGTGGNAEVFNGGSASKASGYYSHAEGYATTASGWASHAEGNCTTTSDYYSHAEGDYTTASGWASHAEGAETNASGYASHAEGAETNASGNFSHAEGCKSTASGDYSHAEGEGTTASKYAQHAQGCYNIEDTDGYAESYSANADAFIIGNGDYNWDYDEELRSNAFRVTFSGATYGLSAFNSSGADYAEYFEWADGNTDNEDRIGHFVALVNGKIKIAEPNEDIIGIVSGMSSVIGNANEDMHHGMYLRDVFGRFLYEDVEVTRPSHEYEKNEDGSYKEDENGKRIPIMEIVTEHRIKLNPDYDATKPYVPRSQRAEWDVIGLLGQIVVIDDGTCVAGGRCDVAEGGIATNGNKYRVMKRLDESHILVLANFL